MEPHPSMVHYDEVLSALTRDYRPQLAQFIATSIFPIVDVGGKTGKYQYIPRGAFHRLEPTERAPGTESRGGGYKTERKSFSLLRHAWHKDTDDETIANDTGPVMVSELDSRYVTTTLLTRREYDMVSSFFTSTSSWGGKLDLEGDVDTVTSGKQSRHWSTFATSGIALKGTPYDDVELIIRKMLLETGYRPNTMLLGYDTHRILRKHPDIMKRYENVASTLTGVSDEQLSQYFRIPNLRVLEAAYNSADENSTDAFQFMANDICWVGYVAGAGEASDGLPSAGYTLSWNDIAPMSDSPNIERWWDQDIKSWRIEGEMYYGMKVVAPDLGFLISNAVNVVATVLSP